MANSRDFTGKNRKFTGTKGITTPKGTTEQRVGSESGELRFNTTTELMEYYDGTQWKPIDAPPTISTVTTSDGTGTNTILNADGSTLYTITINGGNFSLNPVVKFIGSTGTEYTAGNVTRVSSSQITCTTLSSMGTIDDPYDVRVTNTSGLSATLDDAFSYNAAPVFTVASGQLGTVYDGQTISGTTFNAGATDAEGNSITHTIISGSLPGTGLSISSSTGAITGTLGGTPSLGNYPFVVRAATTEGTVERQFSIQVVANPFVAATGGTITTSGDFKVHTFSSPGTFTVTSAGTPAGSNTVEYLVVAGGGGGGADEGGTAGGGGGGGGFRTNFPSPAIAGLPVSAQGYPISVGGAGAGSNAVGTRGGNGGNSTFSNITSAGGGGGGTNPNSPGTGGAAGGSGGGGTHYAPTSGGAGNTPPVSPPQGNPGGANVGPGPHYGSGGGGGASNAGGNGSTGNGGRGGNGTISNISGSPIAYSGGGGGGIWVSAPGGDYGRGGTGGGGDAGSQPGSGNPGAAGTTNSGGGGGGCSGSPVLRNGGNGGSGQVVIRYKFQ